VVIGVELTSNVVGLVARGLGPDIARGSPVGLRCPTDETWALEQTDLKINRPEMVESVLTVLKSQKHSMSSEYESLLRYSAV
jgi:hypothetical protein